MTLNSCLLVDILTCTRFNKFAHRTRCRFGQLVSFYAAATPQARRQSRRCRCRYQSHCSRRRVTSWFVRPCSPESLMPCWPQCRWLAPASTYRSKDEEFAFGIKGLGFTPLGEDMHLFESDLTMSDVCQHDAKRWDPACGRRRCISPLIGWILSITAVALQQRIEPLQEDALVSRYQTEERRHAAHRREAAQRKRDLHHCSRPSAQ